MKKAILFLHGRYTKHDVEFYRALVNGKTMIAVDGGYRFFEKNKISPDLLIGDFDSIGKIPGNLPQKTKIIKYPNKKNKTDFHLALDYCLENKFKSIEIAMPQVGEIDHFLGNIFLIFKSEIQKALKNGLRLSILNQNYAMDFLANRTLIIKNENVSVVSIIPLSGSIILTCKGMEYNAYKLKISKGDSRSLRNKVVKFPAKVSVEGQAVVIQRHHWRLKLD